MVMKAKKVYSLQGSLTNSTWLESNTPVGEVFDHLTQLYSIVYEGMSSVAPEFVDFSFENIEMKISSEKKQKLTKAMSKTKLDVDSYMIKAGLPCALEFAAGI